VSFSITKNEPITVYGGGKSGGALCRRLLNDGFNVVAMVDIKPKNVYDAPLPVYTPYECFERFGNITTIIAVNGLIQTSIAYNLRAVGYDRMLFCPAFIRSANAKAETQIWNEFYEHKYDGKIPEWEDLFVVDASDFFQDSDDNHIVTIVHKDYLRMRTMEMENNKYCHADLEFIITPDTYVNRHWYYDMPLDSTMVRTRFSEEYKSDSRSAFFERMLSVFPDFIGIPATAIFNRSNRMFYIIDGMHRIVFLIEKGISGIPIKMRKQHFDEWFREPEANELMKHCKDSITLPTVVRHPAFSLFPVEERTPDEQFIQLYNNLMLP
jgi:hypothetical protein